MQLGQGGKRSLGEEDGKHLKGGTGDERACLKNLGGPLVSPQTS